MDTQGDFLGDLNLVLEGTSPSMDGPSVDGASMDGSPSNDLNMFSQTDFFDFDVSGKGIALPFKNQHAILAQYDTIDTSLIKLESSVGIGGWENTTEQGSSCRYGGSSSPANTDTNNETGDKKTYDVSTEEKRRRNTAASARFRIKKKMKEQQMEEKSRELRERVSGLEKKLKTLEMENKCLKSILFQQNEKKNDALVESIMKKSTSDSSVGFEFTN